MNATEIHTVILASGTGHYGICDYTLCGRWIGSGQFGDFAVSCKTCLRIYSTRIAIAA